MTGFSDAFASGTRFGRYEILTQLGRGCGSGRLDVYKARDPENQLNVVLKMTPATGHPEALEKLTSDFQREVRVAKILGNHPNIPAVYESETLDGWLFISLEYLEGQSLKELTAQGPLKVQIAERFAAGIAEALARAHERGIVHGHLNPADVFITNEDRVKILGFADPPAAPELFVKPGYAAPEQVRGGPADQRSDVFLFGAILYEMLSGANPFRRNSAVETLSATLKFEPSSLRRENPQVPERLDLLVRRCLAADPKARFQSGGELASDFGNASLRV